MSDRPVLFSAPMVLALLEGWKTQTRRVMKPQPHSTESIVSYDSRCGKWMSCEPSPVTGGTRQMDPWRTVLIQPGDRLWVREAWQALCEFDHLAPRDIPPGSTIIHNASRPDMPWASRKRPSMFMPRWASRLTLIVESVKVERLQDISRGDAMQEGCPFPNMQKGDNPCHWFRDIWDSINAKRPGCSWVDNPWVTATTFEVQHRNIDEATP